MVMILYYPVTCVPNICPTCVPNTSNQQGVGVRITVSDKQGMNSGQLDPDQDVTQPLTFDGDVSDIITPFTFDGNPRTSKRHHPHFRATSGPGQRH